MEVLSSQSSSSSSSPFGYSFGGFNSTNSTFSNSNPTSSSAFTNSAFSTPSTFSNSTRSTTSSFSNSPFSTTAFSTSSTFSDPSSLSASSSIFAPAVDSNYAFAAKAKYAQRAALASSLSGLWEGRSSRHASHISAGIHPHTDWKNCDLQFNIVDGRIHGSGISIWNDKEIPFKIQGCFDRRLERVELVKLHHGEYTTSTHYSLQIVVDGNRGAVMEGTYAHGTIRLRKIQNAKLTTSMSAHSLPTLAQMPSTLAALSSSTSSTLSPLATPLIASNTTSNLSSLLHSSPALDPAAMFMHYLFGSREGEKYYQLLQENQVDFEALKLMKESHLKELGFAMGPRLKIMNSLPGYIASQQSGTTPPAPQPIGGSQSAGSLPPTSVLLGTGFGMLGGTGPSLLSPSHTNTSSPTSTSTPSHDHAQPKIPPEFICSITHDVMEEPVVLADGHTYEKSAITTWLATHNTSPLTGKILRSKELRPNMSLKSIIQDWRERQKWNKNQVSS